MSYAKRLAEARREIARERRRQIEGEGWSPEHDDAHNDGSLLAVATFYYQNVVGRSLQLVNGIPTGWPWAAEWWKPKDRHRDLIRAGALCHAEMDRVTRAGERRIRAERQLKLIEDALAGADH